MQLPQEVRDQIYESLFSSNRFAFGERAIERIKSQRIVSAHRRKALSILRSCRRINHEIGKEWLHQVSFHFEDPEYMLQKLGNISDTLRGEVRRVRVSGHTLMLSFEDDDVYYRTAQALKLLPGLKLDVLTILGDKLPSVSYQTLDMLIRHSHGWKELRCISHSSEFLGYKDNMMYFGPSDPMNGLYMRQPQPSDWQLALERCDGTASKPSVTVYRSKEATAPCAVLQPAKRTIFSQALAPGQVHRSYGKDEDPTLMQAGEREKEVLVIVKRGTGVDYCEYQGSPFLPVGDIREDFNRTTWKEVKAAQDELFKDMRDDDPFSDDDGDGDDQDESCIIDAYSHVDEYTWPPYHFVRDQ